MPRISQFYGIVIAMFYNDHEPAHFRASYGEHRANVAIQPVRVIAGSLPRRVQSLVFEWAAMHQTELIENWQRARQHRTLFPIEPLD
jgi:hypothetical protein